MNIAYIIPALRNTGPVLVVKALVEQMVKNGHQCSVFYFDDDKEVDFPCSTYKISFWKKIDFLQFDVVHSHSIRPDCYVFMHKPWKCSTRFISTLHNYVIPDLSYQYNKIVAYVFGNLWMLFLKRHDCLVALSKDAVCYYKKWFGLSRLTYAYNTRSIALDVALSEQERKQLVAFKQNSYLIGVNALLTHRKGVDLLIQALPGLPDYKLFVVGTGKVEDDLKQLAEQCGVKERVLFAGYHKDAYRYLKYYDVFAIPSRSEGFGLSVLEAAMMKIPVVCSDIPIFHELYSSEEVSFFKLEDIDSLINAIVYAKENRCSLVNRLRLKYNKDYSPEAFYKRYLTIYQS